MQEAVVDTTKVICDNGSGFLKMGFAGENFPRFTIPSIAGKTTIES
jgi:actin-related protein 2